MITSACLFRSLRIPISSVPTTVSTVSYAASCRSLSCSPPAEATSAPPTPYFPSRTRPKVVRTVSRAPLPIDSPVYAHLVPVEPKFETAKQLSNLEVARMMEKRTAAIPPEEPPAPKNPAHLYTAPPYTPTPSSAHFTHLRTFLTHQRNLLTLHLPLPHNAHHWGTVLNPNQRLQVQHDRFALKLLIWDKIGWGLVEELSYEEAEERAKWKLKGGGGGKGKVVKEGEREKMYIWESEREVERKDQRREAGERKERRERRMGLEKEGFKEGGWEREVLVRELGKQPKADADGRNRQPKIGKNRRT